MERLYFIDNHLLNPIVRRQWVDHFTNVVKLLANEFEVVPVMWPISLFFTATKTWRGGQVKSSVWSEGAKTYWDTRKRTKKELG